MKLINGTVMKPPFDAQEATRSIVRVMCTARNWDCGFVAAERYVITAAHCLPRRPAHLFDDKVATTIRSWDGNDEAKLVVIYCDQISDIAVLSDETLSGGYNVQRTEAFDRLVARTGSARMDLSFPVELPLRFYIRTHKEAWLTGSTGVLIFLAPMFSAFIDEGKKIRGGTSGSPVFNQKGEVMGLVSQGGEGGGTNDVTVVWLAGALQGWHIRKLDEWQKEQEAADEIN